MNTEPWTWPDATSRRPSGLQCSHSPTPGRHRLAAARARVGRLDRHGRGSGGRRGHAPMVPRNGRRRYQRATESTSASTSSVVRASTIAPSAPASRQRSHVSRGAVTHGVPRSSASLPVALEPDDHGLVRPVATGLLERLEVCGQVLLEVVVEGRPAVADPRGQPRARPGLAADDDARRRLGHRLGMRVAQRVERRRIASRARRSTALGSRRPPPRAGRRAPEPPGSPSRRPRAPSARRRCRSPASAGRRWRCGGSRPCGRPAPGGGS